MSAVALSFAVVPSSFAAEPFDGFLTGTWQGESPSQAGAEIVTTIHYQAGGSYSGERRIDLGEIGQIMAVSGTWSTQPLAADRFALTRTEDGGDAAETEVLRVVDDDTMVDEATGYKLHRIADRVRDPDAPPVSEE